MLFKHFNYLNVILLQIFNQSMPKFGYKSSIVWGKNILK